MNEVKLVKKVIVTLASVALAGAVNFGVASAHPNYEPTPPPSPANVGQPTVPGSLQGSEVDQEQQGDNQSGAADANDTTGKQDENAQMGEQGTNVDEQGANDANTTSGTQDNKGQSGAQQDGEFEGQN